MARAQQYMIRRTSETLKQYLPAKVQEVRSLLISAPCCGHEFRLHCMRVRNAAATSALAAHCVALHSAVPLHRSPTCVTRQVIFCKMSALQHSIYKGFLASEAVTGAGRAAG